LACLLTSRVSQRRTVSNLCQGDRSMHWAAWEHLGGSHQTPPHSRDSEDIWDIFPWTHC
jgi:hypothetical protein